MYVISFVSRIGDMTNQKYNIAALTLKKKVVTCGYLWLSHPQNVSSLRAVYISADDLSDQLHQHCVLWTFGEN